MLSHKKVRCKNADKSIYYLLNKLRNSCRYHSSHSLEITTEYTHYCKYKNGRRKHLNRSCNLHITSYFSPYRTKEKYKKAGYDSNYKSNEKGTPEYIMCIFSLIL